MKRESLSGNTLPSGIINK